LKPVVLPELRYRRFWFGVGIVIAVAIAVACLVPGGHLPDFSRALSDKTEHFIAFTLLAFWFGSILVRRDLPWLALALVAFGGLIELAQGAMHLGRDAEVVDLVADAVGVAAGLALALTPLGRWARVLERYIDRRRGT
jgi:VanZ family protein